MKRSLGRTGDGQMLLYKLLRSRALPSSLSSLWPEREREREERERGQRGARLGSLPLSFALLLLLPLTSRCRALSPSSRFFCFALFALSPFLQPIRSLRLFSIHPTERTACTCWSRPCTKSRRGGSGRPGFFNRRKWENKASDQRQQRNRLIKGKPLFSFIRNSSYCNQISP